MPIVFEYIAITEVDFHDHIPDTPLDFQRHGVDEFEQYPDGNPVHPGLFVFDLENGFRIDPLFVVEAFEIVFDEMKKKKNGPDALRASGSVLKGVYRFGGFSVFFGGVVVISHNYFYALGNALHVLHVAATDRNGNPCDILCFHCQKNKKNRGASAPRAVFLFL
jgi:hypothetical protein